MSTNFWSLQIFQYIRCSILVEWREEKGVKYEQNGLIYSNCIVEFWIWSNPIKENVHLYFKIWNIKEGFRILFVAQLSKRSHQISKQRATLSEVDSDYFITVIYQSQTIIHSKCYVKTYKFEHNTLKLNVEHILLHWWCKREDIQMYLYLENWNHSLRTKIQKAL